MKLTAALLPGDAAGLLETVLPMLEAIEKAPDEQGRSEAFAATRHWLVGTANELRKADPRGKPPPAPQGQPGAGKPCSEAKPPPVPSPGPGRDVSPARGLGEELARVLLARLASPLRKGP